MYPNIIWKPSLKFIAFIACIYGLFILFQRQAFTLETSHTFTGKRKEYGTCIIPSLNNLEQFYSYFEKEKAECISKDLVGGVHRKKNIEDGGKWVCFDRGFKADNCIVYSFGINNEWSFDDYMDKKQHCQVFAFDPTMKAKEHKRSQRISFFKLGISNFSGYTSLRGKWCSVDRYRGIVEMLGHKSTVIDYLKMDIEGSEIPVFKDILDNDLKLLDNMQQIGIEIHPGLPGDMLITQATDLWNIFHRLECLGWHLLSAEINQVTHNHFRLNGLTRSACYELVWIKF